MEKNRVTPEEHANIEADILHGKNLEKHLERINEGILQWNNDIKNGIKYKMPNIDIGKARCYDLYLTRDNIIAQMLGHTPND